VTAEPMWFDSGGRPMFGWWHVPDGHRARGGVVLCLPLAMEGTAARPTFRLLASRLEAAGFVVLRFDYDGTGDSAGSPDDPGRVPAWIDSVRSAIRVVRSSRVPRVTVVGMRMGATLAAATIGSEDSAALPDGLVLWDPCTSGRSFLRQQRLMRATIEVAHTEEEGVVEGPGIVFGPEAAAAMSALSVDGIETTLARKVLVLTRAGHRRDHALVTRLSMPHVEWAEVAGQEDLVDVEPHFAKVPEAALRTIVSWLSALGADGLRPVTPSSVSPGEAAVVGRDADGCPIRERSLRLGPNGLFGIVTEGERRNGGPTFVFLPAGVIDHTGPARLWVEIGRRWAALGFETLRFDTGGLGDSDPRGSQSRWFGSAPESIDDVRDTMNAVGHGDPTSLVLVGLCSGGYLINEVVLGGMKPRGAYMINPVFRPRDDVLQNPDASAGRLVPPSRHRWAKALPAHNLLSPIVENLPSPAWWALNRVAVRNAEAMTLQRVSERITDMLIISNAPEARLHTRGGHLAFRRLSRRGRFRLEVFDEIDHTLLARVPRDRAFDLITQHVWTRYGSTNDDTSANTDHCLQSVRP